MRQQPPPPTPQPLHVKLRIGRRAASGGFLLKPPSLQPFLPIAPLGVSRRNALGRWPASGGLLLKAPSPQPSRPSAPFAFQRRLLRAVLRLRLRKGSRVWCPQAFAGFGLRTPNTLALRPQGYGLTGGYDTDAPPDPQPYMQGIDMRRIPACAAFGVALSVMPETPGCFASLETRASLRGVGRPFLSPTRPNLHLRAVLGLRPRRCSRVGCPKPLAGSGVRASDPFALALTDAPCPAARSHAALPWLGLPPCALPTGLLLLAAPRMLAVAVPNFPMARNTRWARAGVSGTSPALAQRRLALTDAPCFFVTLAAACSRPTGSAPTLRRPLGAPVPSEFRACGAPVPTLRRSPPLRGRAVMSFFLGWRPER